MLGTGTLFSPKAGMNIVKAALEKTLKQDLKNFDIIYKHHEKIIDFRLYDFTDPQGVHHEKVVYKYGEGEKLCGIIHTMVKEKAKPTDNITMAIANYAEMRCDLFVIRNDEKIKLTFKL